MPSRCERKLALTTGQLAATPRSTTGSAAVRMASVSEAGVRPLISRTGLAMERGELVLAFDQLAQLDQRSDDQMGGHQVAGPVQALKCRAVERGKFFLVNRRKTDQLIVRAVVQFNVERERF